MSIRDKLFQVAPEYLTTDTTELARIDAFISDAQQDVTLPTSHEKYDRAIAYYAAGLITDADPYKTDSSGFALKREKSSQGENEFQTAKSGQHSNKYFDQYYKIMGLAVRRGPFAANAR